MFRSTIRPIAPLLLMLCLAPAAAQAATTEHPVLVVVGAEPGALQLAENSTQAAGGELGRRIDIIDGFTAQIPPAAISGLRGAPGVRMVARDTPLHLSSDVASPDGTGTDTTTADPAATPDPTTTTTVLDTVAPVDSPFSLPPDTIPAGTPEVVADQVIDQAADEASDGTSETAVTVSPTEGAALTAAPDDGSAAARASMSIIGAGAGATDGLTGRSVDVALIDSGVVGLPALAADGQLVRGPDYSEDAGDPDLTGMDAFGHGTHMAGIIAGNDPASGFKGVAPDARLVSVKVAGADGVTSLVRVLVAFDWIRDHKDAGGLHIRALNLSFGIDQVRSYTHEPLAYAVERLWNAGVVVVAAAGNQADGTGELDLPAADPFVVAVGASDPHGTADPSDDTVADFSSSDAVRNPDVVAPGTSVISLRDPGSTLDEEFPAARIGTQYFRGSGTSQATAVVTGIVARILQARPSLNPDQVKAVLRSTAVSTGADAAHQGAGRVNAAAAAAAVAPSTTAAKQPWQPAKLDLTALWQDLRDAANGTAPDVGAGENGWTGRRWSGDAWSGRRWSGRRWSGGTYGD